MPSIKTIKQRIKSVKNTAQITKAMEVVSANKMRKSQEFAIRARPFAVASLEMLKNLLTRTPELPPLLKEREIKKSLLAVITSDKGLAGAFNANVIKKAENWIQERTKSNTSFGLLTIGKKAREYFSSRAVKDYSIYKKFLGFGDFRTLEETLPIAEAIMEGFLKEEFDEVFAVYTHFRTTLLQEVVLKKILPTRKDNIEELVKGILPEHGRFSQQSTTNNQSFEKIRIHGGVEVQPTTYHYEYKFEPSAEEILSELVPQLLKMQIHHIILESNASEHSARMVAMKNASDNAKELISELSLAYNKARQAGITRELIEITAGKEALEV